MVRPSRGSGVVQDPFRVGRDWGRTRDRGACKGGRHPGPFLHFHKAGYYREMKLGIDVLLADPKLQARLKGKRLALLAHPASMTGGFQHAIDALMAEPALKLSSAFGPQHGLRGDKQDNMVES